MALVAIVATLMGSGLTVKRLIDLRADYQKRAIHHEQNESVARFMLGHLEELRGISAGAEAEPVEPSMDPATRERLTELMKSDPELQKSAANMEQEKKLVKEVTNSFEEAAKVARSEVEYHASLKRKYERAAARPWMSIPPDPKESGVDLQAVTEEAMKTMMSKYAGMDSIALPPQLGIVEPVPPVGK